MRDLREYTREEMREACRNNYNAGLEAAARVADGYCTDRTDDVAKGIRALKERQPSANTAYRT